MNRKPKMTPYTKKDFDRQFPDDMTCLEWLFLYFFPDGMPFCDKCQKKTKHHRVISRPSYSCDYCGHHVHPTADTIFHKSPTPLTIWFYAVYLMASTRCGISAKQIQRETGVTYKTAWRMFKQIRSMLDENVGPFGGSGKGVEIDETYYGGKIRGIKNKTKNKACIVGVVERKGKISAVVTPDKSGSTLLGIVREKILPESTVFTDEATMYDGVTYMNRGYQHRRIHHSSKVYVVGEIHTNTVEGFWGLVKNGLRGVYHSVGKGYLQSYLNEYTFRYNHRFDTTPMFNSFMSQIEKRDSVARQPILMAEEVPF